MTIEALPSVSKLQGRIRKSDRLAGTATLFQQGISASEISRMFGVSREQTRKDLQSLGFVTSSIRKAQRSEVAARISTLAASGTTAARIAEQINETELTVRRIGKEFGIKIPRPVTKASIHGTINAYSNGCRCAACRKANTAFCAERRVLRRSRVAEMPKEKHGTISGYENWGCRCASCSVAGADHRRARSALPVQEHSRKSETWAPAEDKLVLNYATTARDLAILLNRTVSSVNTRRRVLRQRGLQPISN